MSIAPSKISCLNLPEMIDYFRFTNVHMCFRAISTEQQVKNKQTENEYLERTIERLKTELEGSKLRHVYLINYYNGQSINAVKTRSARYNVCF